MTFTEKNGNPRLNTLTYNIGKTGFRVKFGRSTIKYKQVDIDYFSHDENFIKRFYSKWIEAHESDNTGYKMLKIDIPIEGRSPLFIISICNSLT